MNPWRAGCAETCKSGSEGGPRKRTGRNPDTAPRPDPYTEHPTREGKVYCCVVLDAFSRMVVGWAIDSTQTTALVTTALGMATGTRNPDSGLVLHSDRGVQGGLNWSSQHFDCGGVYGQASNDSTDGFSVSAATRAATSGPKRTAMSRRRRLCLDRVVEYAGGDGGLTVAGVVQ